MHQCGIYEQTEDNQIKFVDGDYVKTEYYNFENGGAINRCYETDEGSLIVTNDEYDSQVNFCPYCGYEAKKKIEFKDDA